jgi:hypothetical protein
MTDEEMVIEAWVEITTPAGKVTGPRCAFPLDQRLPEGVRVALASMSPVNGFSEAGGVRMQVIAFPSSRARGKGHSCPLGSYASSSDPWSWSVT